VKDSNFFVIFFFVQYYKTMKSSMLYLGGLVPFGSLRPLPKCPNGWAAHYVIWMLFVHNDSKMKWTPHHNAWTKNLYLNDMQYWSIRISSYKIYVYCGIQIYFFYFIYLFFRIPYTIFYILHYISLKYKIFLIFVIVSLFFTQNNHHPFSFFIIKICKKRIKS